MVTVEKVEENFYIVLEMFQSNPNYAIVEWERPMETEEDLREMYEKDEKNLYFIKADDTYIGFVSYENAWIDVLMIHGMYQGYGYGTQAYLTLQQQWQEEGIQTMQLAVSKSNEGAQRFWERLGFVVVEEKEDVRLYKGEV